MISIDLEQSDEIGPLVLLQATNRVRPDLLPLLGGNAILDDVSGPQCGKIQMNIAREKPTVFWRDLPVRINDYFLLKFREVCQAGSALLVRNPILAFRIKDKTSDVRIRRVQFRDEKLDKVCFPVTRVCEDIRPAADQTLHIEWNGMVGLTVPVEYDVPKRKMTKYGRFLFGVDTQ